MDKNAKQILKRYSVVSKLIEKKAVFLPAIPSLLVGLTPAFISGVSKLTYKALTKIFPYDSNLRESISTIIKILRTLKFKDVSGDVWNSTVEGIASGLDAPMRAINARNINTNINSEQDLRTAVNGAVKAKSNIQKIIQRLDYLLSGDLEKKYNELSGKQATDFAQMFVNWKTSISEVKDLATKAKTQAEGYSAELDVMIEGVKDKFVEMKNSQKEEQKTQSNEANEHIQSAIETAKS